MLPGAWACVPVRLCRPGNEQKTSRCNGQARGRRLLRFFFVFVQAQGRSIRGKQCNKRGRETKWDTANVKKYIPSASAQREALRCFNRGWNEQEQSSGVAGKSGEEKVRESDEREKRKEKEKEKQRQNKNKRNNLETYTACTV